MAKDYEYFFRAARDEMVQKLATQAFKDAINDAGDASMLKILTALRDGDATAFRDLIIIEIESQKMQTLVEQAYKDLQDYVDAEFEDFDEVRRNAA